MASSRANKYASLNFNDIYDKKQQQPSSSSLSHLTSPNTKTILSNSRIHGNMLVLSRPYPKPIPPPHQPQPQQQPQPQPPQPSPDPTRSEPDSISLRPLGRTGSGPAPLTLPKLDKEYSPSPSPKTNRFVPPHLRPGFVGREEKPGPGPELQKQQGVRSREFGGHLGSPNRYGEDGRPKSGGGYERMMRRAGESDLVEVNRPGSSGTRPSSSG